VVKTHVHYPTDINLLLDAIRKSIETCATLCGEVGLTEWRQSAYQVRQFKKHYRQVQRLKHSTSKDEQKRAAKREAILEAHRAYLELAEGHLQRIAESRWRLRKLHGIPQLLLAPLDGYVAHAERQIDPIRRRVLWGETLPHAEKVFSIFQPHTEWIVKGKAGVPVELGLRVCVVEDRHRFILHHQVMQRTTDDAVALPVVDATLERFPAVRAVSFDKGFHSPANQTQLAERVEKVVLPKKGKLSAKDRERESDPEFIHLRHQHSAVESAINALEVHGLDRCPDHGIEGFERYVALAVVARNLQRLGAILREQEQAREKANQARAAPKRAA
jgi:transposase, IS5 family